MAMLASEPKIAQRHLSSAMDTSLKTLKLEAEARTPVGANWELRNSIGSEVKGIGADMEGRVQAKAPYGIFVELGTRPHFPPPSALESWCAVILGDPKLAFVIARAISRRGTRARNMFKETFESNVDWVKKQFTQALANIVRELRGR